MNLKTRLEQEKIQTSVPCRVDFGGTLDISTFHLPLNAIGPSSFNIALDLRTIVTLSPWQEGKVKVSSKGFETAIFNKDEAPFDHPMGLMFAVAYYFGAHGVHIHIESTSPPRSALGGSSCAAVAIIAAIHCAIEKTVIPKKIAWLAHYIEASVAGVPCGLQDQLAAAFGGVHQWLWKMGDTSPEFEKIDVFGNAKDENAFNSNILIAYCGIPHVSKDINKQWVNSFVSGETRPSFKTIASLTKKFSTAVKSGNFSLAADLMNKETALRLAMTPDVLDNTGKKLFEKAEKNNCGARFTGAGGGGCLWAIGENEDIKALRPHWEDTLTSVPHGKILDTRIDNKGILVV